MTEFLKACGASGSLVLQVDRAGAASVVTFDQPFGLLDINCESEPPIYAYVQILDGRLISLMLQGQSNDFGNGELKRIRIGPRTNAQIGSSTIRVLDGLPERKPIRDKSRLPVLVIERSNGERWRFRRRLTLIGSSPDCHIRLTDESVLPFHAAVVSTASGVWVVSLNYRKSFAFHDPSFAFRCNDRAKLRFGDFSLRILIETYADSFGGALAKRPERSRGWNEPVGSQEVVREIVGMQHQFFSQFQDMIALVMNSMTSMHREQVELLQRQIDRIERLDRELAQLRSEQIRTGRLDAIASLPAESSEASDTSPVQQSSLPKDPFFPLPGSQSPTSANNDATGMHDWLSQRVAELNQERQGIWTQVCGYLNNWKSPTPTSPSRPKN